MKRSIESKKPSEMESEPFQNREGFDEILHAHWEHLYSGMNFNKCMQSMAKSELPPDALAKLTKKHLIPKAQKVRSPLKKKQRSAEPVNRTTEPESPVGLTEMKMTEMKQWKRKDIVAKMQEDKVGDFKEGWRKDKLVDHYSTVLKSRRMVNNPTRGSQSNSTADPQSDMDRVLPAATTFVTAPPPPNIYAPKGSVRRAIAQREQQKEAKINVAPAVLTEPKSTPAEKPAIKPTLIDTLPTNEADDVDMDANMTDSHHDEEASANNGDPVEKQTKVDQAPPPKRSPISPSIQPGHVLSAKKTFLESSSKRVNPARFPIHSPSPAARTKHATPSSADQAMKNTTPGKPAVLKSVAVIQPKPPLRKMAGHVNLMAKVDGDSNCSNEVPAKSVRAPANALPSLKHASGLRNLATAKIQPPHKGKRNAVAAQMRAKHNEKGFPKQNTTFLPATSQLKPSAVFANSSIKALASVKSAIASAKPKTIPKLAPMVKKQQPPPVSHDCYEMTDSEASDYDSEDSVGIEETRAMKRVPRWARSDNLHSALEHQRKKSEINPDELFECVTTCDLPSIFGRESPRYGNRRRGSGDWSPIGLSRKLSRSQFAVAGGA